MELASLNPRRIDRARLAVNMSHADLAYAVRQVTGGRLKPTEKSIRSWIKGRANGGHSPQEGVIAAIAAVTGNSIEFFYEADSGDDDEEAALLRDIQQLPADLRLRIEARLRSSSVLS